MASATQNLALSAVLFLHRKVLAVPLPWLNDATPPKIPARLPTALTRQEVQAVSDSTDGTVGLMPRLLRLAANGRVQPSGRRQARHVQHQPFAAGTRELDLHARARPLAFEVGNHAIAEFAVPNALADPQAGIVF